MKLRPIFEQILQEDFKLRSLNEVVIILEREIRVGSDLISKLQSIQGNNFAKNILNFLQSNAIKDEANVDYVDYNSDNEKLFKIGYKDREGNVKERLMKLTKLMTYLGGDISNVKGYEIEDVMSYLKKGKLDNVKVVSGEDILNAYHCDNYDEGGTMGSCMRFAHAQSFLQIYTNNPEQIQCLVLINPENGNVRGRALLWKCDDGRTVMDRVYTTNKEYEPEFNTYAENHGMSSREAGGTVTLTNGGEYDEYPFMDTFIYYNPAIGILSSKNQSSDGDWLTLTDTGGAHNGNGGHWSETHGEHIPEDEGAYIEHIDDYVYNNEIVQAWNGEDWLYRDSDDVVWVDAGSYENSWALEKDTVRTHNNRVAIAEDVYTLDDGESAGEYAVSDDAVGTVEGTMALLDETVELTAGQHKYEHTIWDNAYNVIIGDEEAIIHYDDLEDYSEYNPTPLNRNE